MCDYVTAPQTNGITTRDDACRSSSARFRHDGSHPSCAAALTCHVSAGSLSRGGSTRDLVSKSTSRQQAHGFSAPGQATGGSECREIPTPRKSRGVQFRMDSPTLKHIF